MFQFVVEMQPRLFPFILAFPICDSRVKRVFAIVASLSIVQGDAGQHVARLSVRNLKKIFPIFRANPKGPGIWFCLVKARRDWNSPIKINLKLIMA